MEYVDWEIKAREFANCNCNYGCPCQFNAPPTHGHCQYITGFQIDEGHFGEIRLDGLRAVMTGSWPGPIHLGDGAFQVIIDERADADQREALRTIFYGEETEPGATLFNVFMMMTTKVHEPIYRKIDFEVDIDKRTAKLVVEDLVEGLGEPIRNPVTGVEHRSRIVRDSGFEFLSAEMASGTSKSMGAVPMELTSSYGQFANIHLSPYGIVE
jgi:hypothetical protein